MGYATILLIAGLLLGALAVHLFSLKTIDALFLVALPISAVSILCFYSALRMYASGVKAGYNTKLFGGDRESK